MEVLVEPAREARERARQLRDQQLSARQRDVAEGDSAASQRSLVWPRPPPPAA